MAKTKKTAFFCQNCGYESAKWMGQCPACREWNTFVEEPTASKASAGNQGIGSHSAAGRKPVHLTEISTGKEERIPTGIGELDRVLGGGIVPGSLTLSAAIRESENPPSFCRCAVCCLRRDTRFYIFQGRSPCARSNCVLCGSESLMRIFFCSVRQTLT